MVNARCSHFNWRVWALRTSPKHMVAYLSHKSHYKSPCIPVIFPLWSVSYPSYEFHYIVWTTQIMVRFKPWILALSDRSAIKTWQGKKSWRIYMWCWNLNSWTFMCISKHVYTYVYICIHTYMFASVYIYVYIIIYTYMIENDVHAGTVIIHHSPLLFSWFNVPCYDPRHHFDPSTNQTWLESPP